MENYVLPKLVLSDPVAVVEAKQRLLAGESIMRSTYERLIAGAVQDLDTVPLSVMDKPHLPPSGDPHDYVSMSVYFWPNPDTPDGLPYVRRDGYVNPESARTDLGKFQRLCVVVPRLAWAYFLSDDLRFATKAAVLIRTWFLDPGTRMNPHLNYAANIRGGRDGRNVGITDTKSIRFILDGIGLLRGSDAWTAEDDAGMQDWVAAYLKWLLTSRFGVLESRMPNNHGSWHDAHAMSCALFVGDAEAVRNIGSAAKQRMETQFTVEGAQTEELKRTKPLSYCLMNLLAFFEVATMLEPSGVDLWSYVTPEGKSLRKAMEWLVPYAAGEKHFPTADVTTPKPIAYASLFRRAFLRWGDMRFEDVIWKLDADAVKHHLANVQYPFPADIAAALLRRYDSERAEPGQRQSTNEATGRAASEGTPRASVQDFIQ